MTWPDLGFNGPLSASRYWPIESWFLRNYVMRESRAALKKAFSFAMTPRHVGRVRTNESQSSVLAIKYGAMLYVVC